MGAPIGAVLTGEAKAQVDAASNAAAQALAAAEKLATTNAQIDVSEGSQTISSSAGYLELTGVLSADTTLTLSSDGIQKIKNSSTGSYKISIRRGVSGVPQNIPQNDVIEVR